MGTANQVLESPGRRRCAARITIGRDSWDNGGDGYAGRRDFEWFYAAGGPVVGFDCRRWRLLAAKTATGRLVRTPDFEGKGIDHGRGALHPTTR